MLKKAYQRTFKGREELLHFAAHSHHPWPDCTRQAQTQYWDDSAKLLDQKWEYVIGTVLTQAKAHIARHIGLKNPESLAFAPNTHELAMRLLSCFDLSKPFRVLTTDSEFHSFSRQMRRFKSQPHITVDEVAVEPIATFEKRFIEKMNENAYDFIYLSHVFYNSGLMVSDLKKIAMNCQTTLVVDGYHAFGAVPFDLSEIEDRLFYIAGGYKYAQSGEGACFMHVPSQCKLEPMNTGWWSDFSNMESPQGGVRFGEAGWRFAGATMDPSGWYRFNAVMDLWKSQGINIDDIHRHVLKLKNQFYSSLGDLKILTQDKVIQPLDDFHQGHFTTFKLDNAQECAHRLIENGIIVDSRADRLRFGFGIYHDAQDVEHLVNKLKSLSF